MSNELDALVSRVKIAAEQVQKQGGSDTEQRRKLQQIAAEFESTLMVQVLKDMRKAAKWGGEDEEEQSESLGAQALFETIDVELASKLAKSQGFGLAKQLTDQFDRMLPGFGGASAAAPITTMPVAMVPMVMPEVPVTPVDDVAAPTGVEPSQSVQKKTSALTPGVTSGYGWRRDPITGHAKFHKGVDLKAAYGQEVQAAGGGRVVFSGSQGGYGTTVMVEHADGTRTRYAHLSVALVAAGDTVAEGQALGRAGSSGRSTGPHLHFEVIGPNGQALDPLIHRVS